MPTLLTQLRQRFHQALGAAFGPEFATFDPLLVPASQPKFGDYQSNVALSLGKHLGRAPVQVADQILHYLALDDLCYPPQIAGPGFINLTWQPVCLGRQLQALQGDARLGVPQISEPIRVVVDFSSPNIAKEMHVGHLRSTILGDCLARVLEFQGQGVLRLNHVGDWGTQFGMLITYLRQVVQPNNLEELELGDLVEFYRAAKARFDSDPVFQQLCRQAVVDLQSGDPPSRAAWEFLCRKSRQEFEHLYEQLGVALLERGESFYNSMLSGVVADLAQAGLLVEDQGARCVILEDFVNKEGKPQVLIVQKSDGGYNYATTDLAALRYRIEQDRAQRLLYVTDAGQATHFAQVFQVARRAGWVPPGVELVHVPFGLVMGEDGKKFRTRSGDTVRLQSLLDEAKARAHADLTERLATSGRAETPEFCTSVATRVGIAAIKYADLSQNRLSNYSFSYDKMLSLQGNTAPYLLYAYVRIQGIYRRGGEQLTAAVVNLEQETELLLGKHLVQFPDVLEEVARDLFPNRLCQYLFDLSQKFNKFYETCPVLVQEEEERASRLALCNLTAATLKLGLELLGIPVLERL